MKTKIEINYQALGKASALVGFIAALVLFLTWDANIFLLTFGCCIVILVAGIGLMAWGCYRIDELNKEHDEIYRSHLR